MQVFVEKAHADDFIFFRWSSCGLSATHGWQHKRPSQTPVESSGALERPSNMSVQSFHFIRNPQHKQKAAISFCYCYQVPFLPQRCGPPSMQEMALTPFSHNQSRDSRGVPDHLIVAARHHEVSLVYPVVCMYVLQVFWIQYIR